MTGLLCWQLSIGPPLFFFLPIKNCPETKPKKKKKWREKKKLSFFIFPFIMLLKGSSSES